MKLQISTLVTIITAALVFGGFYSETNSRLDDLEAKIEKLESKNKSKNRRKVKK